MFVPIFAEGSLLGRLAMLKTSSGWESNTRLPLLELGFPVAWNPQNGAPTSQCIIPACDSRPQPVGERSGCRNCLLQPDTSAQLALRCRNRAHQCSATAFMLNYCGFLAGSLQNYALLLMMIAVLLLQVGPKGTSPGCPCLVRAVGSSQASEGARLGDLGPDGAGRILFVGRTTGRSFDQAATSSSHDPLKASFYHEKA
jgi:hypothetical protein